MSQQERTGKRPTDFSKWHRVPTLTQRCYLNDIDWIEYGYHKNTLVILAIFELKLTNGSYFPCPSSSQWDILDFFDNTFTCVIWHTPVYQTVDGIWKIDNFWVQVDRNSGRQQYTERNMKFLLEKMHSYKNVKKYYQLQQNEGLFKDFKLSILRDLSCLRNRVVRLEEFFDAGQIVVPF